MTTAPPLLELSNITRRVGHDGQWLALSDAHFTLQHGEMVAITGPSGAGKSTLLNVIGLLDSQWSGDYRLNGNPVDQLNEREIDRLRSSTFGFVFQSSYANPFETTAMNAALGLAIQGAPLHVQEERVSEALETVGLTHRAQALARTLSGGERQRLAIARAIATKPQILLADEPTGNLDSRNSERILSLLHELKARGTSIVLITHDPVVASRADRTIELRDGRTTDTTPTLPDVADRRAVPVVETAAPPRKRSKAYAFAQAVNNVSTRPLRSTMLIAAFSLAIAAMVTSVGIGASASMQISERLATAALDEVRLTVDASLAPAEQLSAAQQIRDLPRVINAGFMTPLDAATARVARFPAQAGDGQPTFRGSAVVTDQNALTLSEATVTPAIALETFGAATNDRVALIGVDVLDQLGVGSPGHGAEVWVAGRPYSVIGTIDDAPRSANLTTSVVIPTETYDTGNAQLIVRTEDGFSASVAEAIPLALSPDSPETILVSTAADLRSLRVGVAEDLDSFLVSLGIALLVLAVLGAAAAMTLSVQARVQELALYRALGLSRHRLAWIFVSEGAILGFAGALAGLALGLTAAVAIAAARDWSAAIPWPALIGAPLIGIISGACAAALPAIRASKVDPADAIR